MPAPTTLPTRLSTAAAIHGLLRAYQPARRAAVVAPARKAAFRPSTVLALSQRRPPPGASKARTLPIPRSRCTKFRMPPILARRKAASYWERLGKIGCLCRPTTTRRQFLDFWLADDDLIAIGLGDVPGRRLALGSPGAFRFLGEDFQPPTIDSPLRTAAQLGLDDVPGPIRLIRIQHMAPDGARCKVGELQASRVGLFVREHDFEAGHSAPLICPVADTAESKFKIIVLSLAASLDDNVRRPSMLADVAQECVCPLHAEGQGHLVGIGWMRILPGQSLLVDGGSDDGEISLFDELIQAVHESGALLLVLQEDKGRLLFAYLVFV